MVKYETTLRIRSRERTPDLLTIFENLYYRKPENAKLAQKFIYMIIERKRVPSMEWQELQKELGATHQEYYTTISKLRDAGFITKVDGEWILSEQFANRCTEMGDIWGSFIKRWKA